MRITNEQIIQSARHQRESVNSRMGVETWHPHHRHSRGIAAAIAIAASFISHCRQFHQFYCWLRRSC